MLLFCRCRSKVVPENMFHNNGGRKGRPHRRPGTSDSTIGEPKDLEALGLEGAERWTWAATWRRAMRFDPPLRWSSCGLKLVSAKLFVILVLLQMVPAVDNYCFTNLSPITGFRWSARMSRKPLFYHVWFCQASLATVYSLYNWKLTR